MGSMSRFVTLVQCCQLPDVEAHVPLSVGLIVEAHHAHIVGGIVRCQTHQLVCELPLLQDFVQQFLQVRTCVAPSQFPETEERLSLAPLVVNPMCSDHTKRNLVRGRPAVCCHRDFALHS